MSKKILMIAGPNGAGKTTMTLELIGTKLALYEFINADEIARGLAPLHPESMALTASSSTCPLSLPRGQPALPPCGAFLLAKGKLRALGCVERLAA